MTHDFQGGPSTTVALFTYGGVDPHTHHCINRDSCFAASMASIANYRDELQRCGIDTGGHAANLKVWPLHMHGVPPDALIDRSRAVVAKKFLTESASEVLIMVDHDIEWVGARKDYEGDLCHIARQCSQTKGVVGACVSKKARHQGIAALWKEAGEYELGQTGLVDVYYVGAAFTAYHRDCLQAVSDTMEDIPPGFKPIFLPMVVDHPVDKSKKLHLSEDWGFCSRASALGFPVHVSMRPLVTHWGAHGYTVIGDSQPQGDQIKLPPKAEVKESGPVTITLLHASRGRPEKALAAKTVWMESAKTHQIEYILSTDDDDPPYPWANGCKQARGPSRGNVDAYDRALKHATGDILIQLHDDVIPPEGWDRLIADRLDTDKPQVLQVSDGGGINQGKPWLVPIAICTRKWADKCGYFFHPSYISVFCDDDFSMKAHKEGVVLDARDITFKHAWGGADGDETYRRSYRQENWKHGEEVFRIRKEAGFPDAEKPGPTF